jgi:hypothetical protein
MSSLDAKTLLEGMAKYGYPLIESQIDAEPEEILLNIAMSDETRFWEGFPVILATLLRDNKMIPDLHRIFNSITESRIRERFYKLCLLSLLVFDHLHFEINIRNILEDSLLRDNRGTENLQVMRSQLAQNGVIEIDGRSIAMERLVKTFMNYVADRKLFERVSLDEKTKLREEFSREFQMSQLFTPRQKDIVRKKLAGEPLTKTEREYYSRTIKKKILALADPELHRLAQKLLEL